MGWEPFYQGLEASSGSSSDSAEPDFSALAFEEEEAPSSPSAPLSEAPSVTSVVQSAAQHFQYKGSYILTSVKSGLMIIDQQRAHINILYNQYLSQMETRRNASQRMLFPDMVHFSPAEVPVLESILPDLSALGFDLSPLGGGSYAINGIPAGIEGLSPEALVMGMVQTAIEKGCKVKEEVQGLLALSLARQAAIVPGQVLTNEEMNDLVDRLFELPTPNYTPDGKLVLSVVKEEELEKRFNN